MRNWNIELELQKKFLTIDSINYEIKRIATYKRKYRYESQWGNVESKQRYHQFLQYEKALKKLKQTYKQKGKV